MVVIHFQVLFATFVAFVLATNVARLFDESVWSEIDGSPLKARLISGSSGDHIEAIITNAGSQATYWSLSEEDLTSKLQVYNSDDEPAARGVSAHAHEASNTTYQLLEPGASTTTRLDVLEEYDLTPGGQYYLQLGGFMPYYYANQDPSMAQTQSHIFEAKVLPFTAPTSLPPKRYTNAPATPNVLFEACVDAEMGAKLKKAVPQALIQAKKSIAYVQNGTDRKIMQNFFKSDSPETRKIIIDRFTVIIKILSSEGGPAKLACSSASGSGATNHRLCVAAGAVAMTDPPSGKVSLCPAAKKYPVEFKACGDSNWGGTLIHEMTHSKVVFTPVTTDITYTLQGCKGLSTQRALLNANSFNFLADSVMLGRSC